MATKPESTSWADMSSDEEDEEFSPPSPPSKTTTPSPLKVVAPPNKSFPVVDIPKKFLGSHKAKQNQKLTQLFRNKYKDPPSKSKSKPNKGFDMDRVEIERKQQAEMIARKGKSNNFEVLFSQDNYRYDKRKDEWVRDRKNIRHIIVINVNNIELCAFLSKCIMKHEVTLRDGEVRTYRQLRHFDSRIQKEVVAPKKHNITLFFEPHHDPDMSRRGLYIIFPDNYRMYKNACEVVEEITQYLNNIKDDIQITDHGYYLENEPEQTSEQDDEQADEKENESSD